MDLNFITDIIITILILPIQVVLIPVDALLAQIPGIGAIPSAIQSMTQFIGSFPSTMVNLLGINTVIWNIFFFTFLLYITLAPGINLIKKFGLGYDHECRMVNFH